MKKYNRYYENQFLIIQFEYQKSIIWNPGKVATTYSVQHEKISYFIYRENKSVENFKWLVIF